MFPELKGHCKLCKKFESQDQDLLLIRVMLYMLYSYSFLESTSLLRTPFQEAWTQ